MDDSGHTVPWGPIDAKVDSRFAGSADLRADARIRRGQFAILVVGPIGTNAIVEALGASHLYRVVEFVHPFDVGAETGVAGEVQRHVHAEAAGLRNGVDEVRERRASGEGETVAFCDLRVGNVFDRKAVNRPRERKGSERCAVDQLASSQGR